MGGVCSEAIESQNVVGYVGDNSISDNNFVSIPFALVGYNTSDIQQIKISDGGAGTIGWGTETFAIWEGLPTVAEKSEFVYWDASMNPEGPEAGCFWGNENQEKAAYSIALGQAVVINCVDADLDVNTSGEVPTGAVSFKSISDNNFTGNPFPAAIDIQNISISDGGAGAIGWGTETFAIWEGLPVVREGSEFVYWDASMNPEGPEAGCFWGNENQEKVSYTIAPGQGVVINTVDSNLDITIAPPYSL